MNKGTHALSFTEGRFIEYPGNFNAPYYSKSVKEFWRRWHISLSGWFRDYLYISLGGNRQGCFRKRRNVLAVFGISGLWHGASLAFIFWGILNGIYQEAEDVAWEMKARTQKYREKWGRLTGKVGKATKESFSSRLFQTIVTFVLVTFAWLFFRAGGLADAKLYERVAYFNCYPICSRLL